MLSFVVYFNLINLSQAWVASRRMEMPAALALVHGGAFLLAVGLIWWRDHGTVLAPRRGRIRRPA